MREAIVDETDGDLAGLWSTTDKGRLFRRKADGKRAYIHRIVAARMVAPGVLTRGMGVRHRNGNYADNRRENLVLLERPAVGLHYYPRERASVVKRGHRTSLYRGVCWISSLGKWQARWYERVVGQAKKRTLHLGYFAEDQEIQAALRVDKEAKLRSKNPILNFPSGPPPGYHYPMNSELRSERHASGGTGRER